MQIPVVILASIETAINTWLKLDEEALPRFSKLDGKIICLHVTGLDIRLYFIPTNKGIEVLGNYPEDGVVDATIHGSPLSLIRLSTSQNAGETLLKSDVEIEGDTQVAEIFSAILREVDIDWEELLSKLVGDIFAHQTGQAVRSASDWFKESTKAMQLNTGEYLSEETRMTPADSEISHYLDQVDEVHMGVDRLEARIKLLQDELNTSANNHSDTILNNNWNNKKQRAPRGERIRKALEDLGPVFVKFGQVLSTRRDLLPDDLANELAKLQDDVPPFSGKEARKIIENSLDQSVEELFTQFDETPLASASIAQVHTATLPDGHDVIVKVVRPGIEKTIRHDIDLMFLIARMVHRFSALGKRLRPVEVVEEYEKTIIDELDLAREAANASQLRRNSAGSNGNFDDLYVPDVYWDYCSKDVMVMERIYGIPIGDIERLKANGTNMKSLGERGVEIFFTQVFTYNFFHADMHPGNIFVDESNPENPRYLAVDFGIVGTLTPTDQRYLAENLHAFFNRDYKRVAEAHIESGWVPATTKANEFEAAIRTVCEPIFQLPIKDISYGKLLLRLFQTARRFNMEVQPQLVLLQKTLLNIEGMGRQLYPDLDLWATAKPFLQRWMDEQVGVRHLFKGAKENLPKFMEQLPHMPVMINEVIRHLHDKQLNTDQESDQLEQLRKEIKAANRRTTVTISGATLIMAGLFLNNPSLNSLSSSSILSVAIGGTGLAFIIYGLIKK
ncbi:putative protein kinase UbiB [Nymphon striatum]|nr:putative protein kinase UbiB [Nymphon striatum]